MTASGVCALLAVVALGLAAPPPARAEATWTPTGDLTTPRGNHTATLLSSGKVLVAGGRNLTTEAFGALANAELYDPASGRWTPTGSMAEPRFWHTATSLRDGRVLLAGGFSGTTALASAELYDPVTGRWSPTGTMSTRRGFHTATLLADGKVLVAGGSLDWGAPPLTSAEVYDPATGRWSPTGPMHNARSVHTATALADGRVLVAGGMGISDEITPQVDSAELYEPGTGRWTPTGRMNAPRSYQTATALPDGEVLVAGGYVDGRSADIYDPGAGRWLATPSMGHYHYSLFTATVLRDGTVLVAGGSDPRNPVRWSELYDPAGGVWRDAAPMTVARYGHTATLLRDGRVLVAGDLNSGGNAELYGDAPDEIAPASTATVSPAPNLAGWNPTPVTVTLRAVDEAGGSGVAALTYRASGAQPIATTTVAAARATIVVGAQGTTTLHYVARDAAGNVETARTRVLRIDVTAPSLRVRDVGVPATSPAGALVRAYPVSTSDNLDPAPVTRCAPPAPHLFAPDSTATVTCTATDRAGNTVHRAFQIHISGAAEQILALRTRLAGMAIQPRVQRRLDRDLAKALRALQRRRPHGVCAHLHAFLRHVDRYARHGTLSATQTTRLRADGSRIASVASCSTGNHH